MGKTGGHHGETLTVGAAQLGAVHRSSPRASLLRPVLCLAFLASSFCASAAMANIIEIASDGRVLVRDGSGAATWEAVDAPAQVSDQRQVDTIFTEGATSVGQGIAVPQRFAALTEVAARLANISPALLAALVWQESRWNPQALSSKGAMGLAQLMPDTARELRVDPRDPSANLIGGARYLRQLLDMFGGDVERALAAYNAGPGRVRRANGIPAIAETQAYVRSIVQRISSIHQELK